MYKYGCEDIIDAARAIRPLLPDLLGHSAMTVGQSLDYLLVQAEADPRPASRYDVAMYLYWFLAHYPATKEWMDRSLYGRVNSSKPPTLRFFDIRGYPGGPPGDPSLGSITYEFQCPVNGCPIVKTDSWNPYKVESEMLVCETHGVPLVRRSTKQ